MSVKVLKTDDTWYGMTYHEDVASVKDSFKKMLENGLYKADLFADLWYTGSGSSLRCSINNHTPLRGEQQATIYYDRRRCEKDSRKWIILPKRIEGVY